MSLPLWECGLKFCTLYLVLCLSIVAPFVGVWIEIGGVTSSGILVFVAPFVGVWIEIGRFLALF